MRFLQLLCKACSVRFESGVPFRREHLGGAKVRSLEVCPSCGAPGDYRNEDYADPEAAPPEQTDTPAASL